MPTDHVSAFSSDKRAIKTATNAAAAAATILWPPGLCPGLPGEPVDRNSIIKKSIFRI